MPINPKTADNKQQQSSGIRTAGNSRATSAAGDLSQDETVHQELAKRLAQLEEVMLDDEQEFPDGSLQNIIFNSLKAIANNVTQEQGNSNNSNNSDSSNRSNDNNISEAGLVKLVEQCVQELITQLSQSPDDKTIQQDCSKLRDYLEDFLTWQASLTSGFPVDIQTYHKILSYIDSEVEATALSLTCKAHYLNTKAHRLPSHLQWLKTPARDYACTLVRWKNILSEHGNPCCLITLPNGFIVSGLKDGSIDIWNPSTGEYVSMLPRHNDRIYCLTTLPNGFIVSGARDEAIKIWNPKTGKCVRTLIGHDSRVAHLTTLPNGFIVSGACDKTIKIWNPNTGQCIRTLEGHYGSVNCLTTLPNGFIVSGSWDRTLKIWNPKTGECVRTLGRHHRSVNCLTTLPNGCFVSGSDDKNIIIWSPETDQYVSKLQLHEREVCCLITLPNGCIVSGCQDYTKIWSFKRLMPKHDAKNLEQNITHSHRQFLFGNSNSTNSNAGASVNTNINLSTGNTTDNAPNSNHFKRGQP